MSLVLVDTPVFVAWMARDSRVGQERSALLSKAKGRIAISQASWLEIAMELQEGRLRFPLPAQLWLEKAIEAAQAVIVPMTPAIVARSGRMPGEQLDAIDRILAATAIEYDFDLATWNPHLMGLPGIRYFF